MPSQADVHRADLTAALDSVAREFGYELAESGKLSEPKPIDPATGFWAEPARVVSKPPRWLIHLRADADGVRAELPDHARADRPAFFNTANRSVGIGCFRIIATWRREATGVHQLSEDWAWLMWFAFCPGLRNGSSGQTIDSFDPTTGELVYMNDRQTYIDAGICGLCDPTLIQQIDGREVTYSEASAAIQALIHVCTESANAAPGIGGDDA